MAIEVRYVATRNRDGNTTPEPERGRRRRERLRERVQAGAGQPAGEHRRRAAARPSPISAPARARRRCRSTSRTSTASRRAVAGDPAQYTGANWTNTTQVNQVGSDPVGGTANFRAPSRRGVLAAEQRDVPDQHAGGGTAGELLGDEPGCEQRQSHAEHRDTKYDALLIELRRRSRDGLSSTGNYTFATRLPSVNDTLRQPLEAGARHGGRASRASRRTGRGTFRSAAAARSART